MKYYSLLKQRRASLYVSDDDGGDDDNDVDNVDDVNVDVCHHISNSLLKRPLSLAYMVSHVSWVPFYDIKVHSQDSNLLLTYFGKVRNNSGEDWTDVS